MHKYLNRILYTTPLMIMCSMGVTNLNAVDNQTLDGSTSTLKPHDKTFQFNVNLDEQKALKDEAPVTVEKKTDVNVDKTVTPTGEEVKSVEKKESTSTVVPDKTDTKVDVKTDVVPDVNK